MRGQLLSLTGMSRCVCRLPGSTSLEHTASKPAAAAAASMHSTGQLLQSTQWRALLDHCSIHWVSCCKLNAFLAGTSTMNTFECPEQGHQLKHSDCQMHWTLPNTSCSDAVQRFPHHALIWKHGPQRLSAHL